jgi:hypothetical protein
LHISALKHVNYQSASATVNRFLTM